MGQILQRSETFMEKSVLPVSVSLGLSLSAHAGLFCHWREAEETNVHMCRFCFQESPFIANDHLHRQDT